MIATKPPTSTDLKIYDWMSKGNTLDGVKALKVWKKTGYRDVCYRLRRAGYPIQTDIIRTNVNGVSKCFAKYSVPNTTV